MNEIIKIIKSLEESGLLIKDISKAIENQAKEQKGKFSSMLLDILGTNLFGNLLRRKEAIETTQGGGIIRACKGAVRADKDF